MEQSGVVRMRRWPTGQWHPLLVDALLAVVLAAFVLRSSVLDPGAPILEKVTARDDRPFGRPQAHLPIEIHKSPDARSPAAPPARLPSSHTTQKDGESAETAG